MSSDILMGWMIDRSAEPPTSLPPPCLPRQVELLRWRVVKRWTAQVLEALAFFHSQSPAVVHK